MSEKKNSVRKEISEIENKEQLREAFDKYVEMYKEGLKGMPEVAKRAVELGFGKVVSNINQRYANMKQDLKNIGKQGITNEMGVARDAIRRKDATRNWQQAHEGRNKNVTEEVENIQNATTKRRSIMALGTVKLSTLGAKGARLFGAKGLAEKIQTRGSTYAHALMTKDSRVDDLAQNMAENGFIAVDKVKKTFEEASMKLEAYSKAGVSWAKEKAQQLRQKASNLKEKAKDFAKAAGGKIVDGLDTAVTATYVVYDDSKKAIKQGVKNAVASARENAKNRREDMAEIGQQGVTDQIHIAGQAANKKSKSRDWMEENADRSKAVTGAVNFVDKSDTSVRSVVSMGLINLGTWGAKGARLFGAKGLAKSMQEKTSEKAIKIMEKESKVGKFFKGIAEKGFKTADKVRDNVEDAKQIAGAYAKVGLDKTIEIGKAGALAIGKGTVLPAAATVAAVSLVVAGAKKAGEKIVENVKEKAETVDNYREMASAKIQGARARISEGFNSRAGKIANSIISKLSGAAEKFKSNKELAAERREESAARFAAAKGKVQPQNDLQSKENGPEL